MTGTVPPTRQPDHCLSAIRAAGAIPAALMLRTSAPSAARLRACAEQACGPSRSPLAVAPEQPVQLPCRQPAGGSRRRASQNPSCPDSAAVVLSFASQTFIREKGPAMTAESDRMINGALGYARRGWPVFPCQPGTKEPATRHGFRDASTDCDQISHWWSRQPDANVAIATGLPGPDVLDVDQHGRAGTGFPAYNRLRSAGLLDGVSAVVATPSGGLHAYFAGSGQASGRLPRHHLDFRSAGGYVLAPPSQVDSKPYRFLQCSQTSVGLDWSVVTGLLDPRQDRPCRYQRARTADASRLAAWVERLQEGNRNSGLYWAACRAVETGQASLLDDLAAAAAKTGLPDREIARTIASALRSARSPSLRRARRETSMRPP